MPNTLTGEGNMQVDISFENMSDFSPAAIASQVDSLKKLMEARILFEEMLARHPNYAMAGEPTWVASSLVRGMESMPLAWDA